MCGDTHSSSGSRGLQPRNADSSERERSAAAGTLAERGGAKLVVLQRVIVTEGVFGVSAVEGVANIDLGEAGLCTSPCRSSADIDAESDHTPAS